MPLRAIFQFVASWLVCVVFGTIAIGVTFLTLGRFSRTFGPWWLGLWGRQMLRVAGVTLEVEGAEHLAADGAKIATFNHGSLLDAFIMPVLFPPGGVAAIKHQARYYPFVGLTIWLLGFVFVDRGNSARAKRTMARAAERMAKERLTVFISPEGTRSPTPELLPFKKGPMHLALVTKAPIVPVLVDHACELHPPGAWATRPGHLRIRVLPPRPTTGLTPETIGAETEALRELYVRELAKLRAERPEPVLEMPAFEPAP